MSWHITRMKRRYMQGGDVSRGVGLGDGAASWKCAVQPKWTCVLKYQPSALSWRVFMSEPIKKLTIEGFKSIRKLEDFELRSLNVLIGANGAGKSNFVGFFRLLRELIEQKLQLAVRTEGGADACLYMGPRVTRQLSAKLYFGANGYEFALVPTADNQLAFADEATVFSGQLKNHIRRSLGSGHIEAQLKA